MWDIEKLSNIFLLDKRGKKKEVLKCWENILDSYAQYFKTGIILFTAKIVHKRLLSINHTFLKSKCCNSERVRNSNSIICLRVFPGSGYQKHQICNTPRKCWFGFLIIACSIPSFHNQYFATRLSYWSSLYFNMQMTHVFNRLYSMFVAIAVQCILLENPDSSTKEIIEPYFHTLA